MALGSEDIIHSIVECIDSGICEESAAENHDCRFLSGVFSFPLPLQFVAKVDVYRAEITQIAEQLLNAFWCDFSNDVDESGFPRPFSDDDNENPVNLVFVEQEINLHRFRIFLNLDEDFPLILFELFFEIVN